MSDINDQSLFEPAEIDVKEFKRLLLRERAVDRRLLRALKLLPGQLAEITENSAAMAFNDLVRSPDFCLEVDTSSLQLDPGSQRVLEKARQAHQRGDELDPTLVQTLNRALLHASYASALKDHRRSERISSPELSKTVVTLTPLPPAAGEPIEAKLLNISAGGTALLLDAAVPAQSFFAMRMTFQDSSEIETVVQIRHHVSKGDKVVCGFEFINIPSYIKEQVEQLSTDYLACEARIAQKEAEICFPDCSFFKLCKKPQHKLASPTLS